MCASAVAISYIIEDEASYSYLIIGLLIILCTTTTLCLVFVPKVREYNPFLSKLPYYMGDLAFRRG